MRFRDLNLSEEMLRAIEEMGYTEPSPIQEKAIPVLMEGRDVIGRSNTGTGKTAAFGIPAVERMSRDGRGVEVLILCPTRELAMQACGEIRKFSKHMPWIKPAAVYGGASIEKQITELKRGANIIIGTPGRVMDHIGRKTLRLESLKEVILDEADEMLNMGFREDIEEILKNVPEERQTVLFSATMPPAILAITKKFQKDPVMVKIENKTGTVESIEQYYYDVPAGRKTDALSLLLMFWEPKLSMVFCNTKRMVDELAEELCTRGFKAAALHGDMKQAQRTQVMGGFKGGRISILIATDVAARGIDVEGVDMVFNYDLPQDMEYYIHRIGRTGRAGKAGAAHTLISGRKQFYDLRDIMRFTKAEITKGELPSARDISEKRLDRLCAEIKSAAQGEVVSDAQRLLERLEADGISARDAAIALIGEKIGESITQIPEIKREKFSGERYGAKVAKVVISVGRRQKIAPNYILGALVDATGMPGKAFGKIDIFDSHTTVEVPDEDKEHVIETMNDGKINGNKVTVRLFDGKREPKRESRKPFVKKDNRKKKF